MNATTGALLGYILWVLILVIAIVGWRTWLTLSHQRRANSYTPTGEEISPLFQRLCRAHANCYEHFPIFGGLLLLAIATGQPHLTAGLAWYFLAARVMQSCVQISSGSELAVQARFTLFAVQIVIALVWLYQFARLYFGW